MDMVERMARAMAPMFADANSYWCNGTEWPDCPPATCQCRKMAFEAARAAIAAMNDVEPVVLASDGSIVHELRGAPRDLWLVLMAAALMNTEPQAPSSE